ncbi:MAG: peptidoglycan DD-metalloendopeptidase family protein, partial [Gammaproteobacteria bacterium]|nr:peptidoglycan DD-metalloendopeptidase family protein [Gammaproteobacteria bacterium]
MSMPHKFLLLLLPLLYLFSEAVTALPREQAVPGGIALINLSNTDTPKPTAHLGKHQVLIRAHEGQWQAVVGLSLETAVGTNTLQITSTKGEVKRVNFKVKDKRYPETHITIKDKRKVNPYKDDLERIYSEQRRSRTAFNRHSELEPDVEFILPISGRLSGNFGRRRFFNKQPRKPHSGMDIAAPTGTEVISPAAGKIVDTGDFFFNGNTVFVDHG